jgi:hypothetical protein
VICLARWKCGSKTVRAQEHPPGSTAAQGFENMSLIVKPQERRNSFHALSPVEFQVGLERQL